MESIFFVALGGSVGSATRYLVSVWAAGRLGTDFPYGTLIVNIVGCYIIGLFMILATEKLLLPNHWRLLVASGFLGGLTTFSTFGAETFSMAESGHWGLAGGYAAASLVGGLLAVWAGFAIHR